MQEAISDAQANGWRQRAVCYVTRGSGEVLALRHAAQPGDTGKLLPGIQVPAGGLDVGETPAEAAVREVFEETELEYLSVPVYLGSCRLSEHNWTGLNEVWHYFQLAAPLNTNDAWRHLATGVEDNNAMMLEVWFTSLAEPDITDDYGSHEYLPELTALLSSPQSHRRFDDLAHARAYAAAHSLREKAVCHVTRRDQLLVFDHVPDNSGVQVPSGGVESGETPAQAASRECVEETGYGGYGLPVYLGSAVWINAEHAKRELRHFFHLLAPPDLPDTWDHDADEHCFRFRWVPLAEPRLDWNFDLILPTSPTSQELSHD